MKLYSNPLSPNCRKVHAVIAHTEIAVERQNVDLMQGEQKTPEFLERNPNGLVPVLVDGDLRLWESNAIACYLAGKADSPLWPASEQRYDIMRWLFWEANHFAPPVAKILGEVLFKPMRGAEPDPAVVDEGLQDFRHFAAVLDGRLDAGGFVSGDSPTVADFVLAVWLGYEQLCGLPVAEFAHVDRWRGVLAETPGYAELAAPAMG